METGAITFKWHWKGTKLMTPDSQTIFSITLFAALSSLLAWSSRRHRSTRMGIPVAVSLAQGNEPTKTL
jgi:hypothetical protein